MNEYDKLKKTMFLTSLFDKDKLKFIPAMDFHKICLQDEKNKDTIKIHKQAIHYCILGLVDGLIPREEIKKDADIDKLIDIFVSHKGNMSSDDTDFNELFK